MMGIFGIVDVIRKEVPKALEQCKAAGITVRMVTGDNKETARAIAIKCGLIDPQDKNVIIIEGSKFIELTGGIICKKYISPLKLPTLPHLPSFNSLSSCKV